MKNKLISLILVMLFTLSLLNTSYAETKQDDPSYTTLRSIDIGTFNEYRYRITEQYFILRDNFKINGTIGKNASNKILDLANKGYNYLPNNLNNRSYLSSLSTAVKRGIKYPQNESNYSSIIKAVREYLENTTIKSVKGTIEVSPKSGNAPLTVTLRGRVKDPTGTSIPNYNYVWWIDNGGKKKIIGNKISISYTFREEGNFSVFLDVKSNHKNVEGYTDVLSFSSRADIEVKEKVASLIIKVNSDSLRQKEVLKFTPEESKYGLVFDATSSTPTSGGKFIKTEWDFGNGVKRKYNSEPKIERVVYAGEGEFTVKLTLKTNELKTVERKFVVSIHNPIATIKSSLEEGFLGDKFTFSAKPTGNDDNLTYSWEIIDIDRDDIIFRKSGSLFTYSFKKKGKYNLKLKITDLSGEEDLDTKIIYINSRAPVADFSNSIPNLSKPNEIFLDATKSYDPDFTDDGKLDYSWIIDGERIKLERPNFNGSSGFYTFDSIGEHSVVLEVTDPDNISNQKKSKVRVNSILSVEFFAFPRVVQREGFIRFVANSPEARFYEWNFGDGVIKGGKNQKITHSYKKSGIFEVKLKVRDDEDNSNTFSKVVYVGESNRPLAFIGVKSPSFSTSFSEITFRKNECGGKGAYIANRIDSVRFSSIESINVDGESTGLSYSWKIGNDKYFTTQDLSYKFDEVGCFPVKLTVKSDDNGKTDSTTSWIKVENLAPILSFLDISVVNVEFDPVVVNVSALGAKDRDGVIQSYLWYYYTDIDPEPQDFRATNGPSTTFVLPKVTGDYYFVVVMKDNNEERITSEEITGGKNSITLIGDNVNTPLIDLSVNDSSVSVGDEVIFTATVKNILRQDISKKVSYSWDSDGDGFYDKQTKTPIFAYKFSKSGEFHPKVKVKYKGFSNTKNLTVNVVNKLVASFDYISIGNKYIFLNKSSGTSAKTIWDMGDGNKLEKENSFIYEYKDKKTSHIVELKISEGTKVKKVSTKILRNLKNTLKAKKPGLNVFSSPAISENGDIVIDEFSEGLFIYAGESKGDFKYYSIDYDTLKDSDLNGGKDDDSDNKKTSSYISGEPFKIKLNDKKLQTIRISLVGEDGTTTDSMDINIIKNYISEEDVDIDSINFSGVSDSERIKIEQLKEMVKALPQEFRLKSMMYVQKLQEEWFDSTEKTRVILEFEGFIDFTGYPKSDDVIDLLESLLVEGQDDKSEKNITFNALKSLIPNSVVCEFPEGFSDCYTFLVSKLEEIKVSADIQQNKKIGGELLNIIKQFDSMTNKQKVDFRAILKTFVYGGVENIPDDTKDESVSEPEGEVGGFFSLLKKLVFWILMIILLFVGIIFAYWLYYKFTNKDKDIGFQDFIIDKTSNTEVKKVSSDELIESNDVLGSAEEKKEEKDEKEEKLVEDKVEEDEKVIENNVIKSHVKFSPEPIIAKESVKEEDSLNSKVETGNSDIPDWLSGATNKVNKSDDVKEVNIVEEVKPKEEKDIILEKPLKPSLEKEQKLEKQEKVDEVDDLEEITKIEENKIPDWLKGSLSDNKKKSDKVKSDKSKIDDNLEQDKDETKTESSLKSPEPKVEKNKKEEKKVKEKDIVSDDKSLTEKPKDMKDKLVDSSENNVNIPDWLNSSFSSDGNKKEDKSKKDSNISVGKAEGKATSNSKLEDTKKPTSKNYVSTKASAKVLQVEKKKPLPVKEVKSDKPVKDKQVIKDETKKVSSSNPKKAGSDTKVSGNKSAKDKKELVPKTTTAKKVVSPKKPKNDTASLDKPTKNKKDELWDDGMKIPDWLKTSDDEDRI